jgi:hypothetical protein
VTHHHRIGVGADDLDGVGQGLALLGAGVATVGEADDVAAQALDRGLEGETGAGGGFEEATGDQLVFQQAAVGFGLQPLCGCDHQFHVGPGQVRDGDDVFVIEWIGHRLHSL